ncbi:MAG: A24 family peptidase [Eubacteriales bacterium]|nr:A24 family peptidase [Eubacteriales bacterium]
MQILLEAVFTALLLLAAGWDFARRRIPDGVVLGIALTGAAAFWVMPQIGAAERFVGLWAVSVPVLLLTLLRPGAFGGGDIKLLAAGGLFLGARLIWEAFLWGMVAAGLWSLVLLLSGRGARAKFALGPFLCLGMLLVQKALP